MKPKHDLPAAIAAVEQIRAEAEAAAPRPDPRSFTRLPQNSPDDYAAYHQRWSDYYAAGGKAVQRLVDEHGARFRLSGAHEYRLTLAGVTTTCTAGEWGLMSNWLNAARRKLAKEG